MTMAKSFIGRAVSGCCRGQAVARTYRGLGAVAALTLVTVLVAGCGGSGGEEPQATNSQAHSKAAETGIPPVKITPVTPAAKGTVASVTWDDPYGEPQSLDPLKAWALPENTVLANMCESLMRVGPNNEIEPALATKVSEASPTSFVFTIRKGVKFWDGHPMTVADVVYSLDRQVNPKNASFYSVYTSEIKSVTQSGREQVTVTTKTPYVLMKDVMALGISAVIEKEYAERAGSKYGTSSGGIMCTGPFEFKSWTPGESIAMARNPDYWNASGAAKAQAFTFKFITNPATVIDGLESGELEGAFQIPVKGLAQLQSSGEGKLYFGPSMLQNVIQGTATSGPGNNPLVRQALSDALNRRGIAEATFSGFAEPARWISSPWTYGYERQVFQAAYKALPDNSNPDLAAARKLVAKAGNPKSTLTVACLAGEDASVGIATELASAAQQIGLNMQIRQLPSAAYTNALFEASARKGIDFLVGTGGVTFQDVPDPVEALIFAGVKGAQFNLDNYDNPKVNEVTEKALATPEDGARAKLVAEALTVFTESDAILPVVFTPETVFLNKRITGATSGMPAMLFYPWAAGIGAAQ